jgi:hypothetical protein
MTLPLARLTDFSNAAPWSRIFVALLLSLGIFFGLKQLCMAGLLAAGDEIHTDIWTTRGGPALVLALQSIGLLLGGILVGAGQKRGPSNGFIVGTFSGLVFVAAFPSEVPAIGRYSLVIDLVYLSFIGVVSGCFGKNIWKPLQDFVGIFGEETESFGLSRHKRVNPLAGPISWFRVAIGLIVCIPPSCWGLKPLYWAMDYSQGLLTVEVQQMRLVSWMVTAAALLVGSVIAGSAVSNSFKQGLCVGIATIAVVIGHRFYFRGMPPVTWLLLTVGVTMGACLLGGWFGGQLLPPLGKPRNRLHIGPVAAIRE